jgi:phage shock protein PspC (stress-responsive transcriptional regulator)
VDYVYNKYMKRLVRPKKGRMIAGVAMGMANYFGVDVTLVRLIWFILLLPGGIPGFFLYLVCWVIIPSDS